MLVRGLGGLRFRIPTLRVIANDRFVNAHCFHYGGLSLVNDERLVRVDIVASDRIRSPDVNGSIYLDPRTFQIRRTVFSLTRRPPSVMDLADMEVETWFRQVMVSIPIISYVSSVQTLTARARRDVEAQVEVQWLTGFTFLDRRPGAAPPRD